MPYSNKKKLYDYQIKRWINIKKKAIEHMGGACSSCGYNKFYGALEFHHIDPTKKDVSWTRLRLRSWEKIIFELNKCVMLCANCHREKHYNSIP